MADKSRRATASERRRVEAGGRRMPGGVLSAEAARALEALLAAGYAHGVKAVIERALKDAADA